MLKKMESLYKDLAKFYAFDVKKYTLEEFFADIKTFKDNFSVSTSIACKFFSSYADPEGGCRTSSYCLKYFDYIGSH